MWYKPCCTRTVIPELVDWPLNDEADESKSAAPETHGNGLDCFPEFSGIFAGNEPRPLFIPAENRSRT